MTNDEKDRHVTAAAVHGEAQLILTFNLRHFRQEHLEPWNIQAMHPQDFLAELFRQEQAVVITQIAQQTGDRSRSFSQLLKLLSISVPAIARLVSESKSSG